MNVVIYREADFFYALLKEHTETPKVKRGFNQNMNSIIPYVLPDLIINICPLGCNRKCVGIWINSIIGHRIICKCPCKHNQAEVASQLVEEPEAKATQEILSSSQEQTPKR